MPYEPTVWKNKITDSDGTVVQQGTPLTADNMNKIEGELVELSTLPSKVEASEQKQLSHEQRITEAENEIESFTAEKGQPNGLATLGTDGIIPSSQLPSNLKEIKVVANIAERDLLVRFEGLRVLVTDASGDTTVNIGWAEYVWNSADWIKTAEAESLDLVVKWSNVTEKPTTFPSDTHKHTEAQITDLDKYTQAEIDAMLSSQKHTEADITDLDKYTKAELDALLATVQEIATNHISLKDNPHVVTKTQIGLSSVPNAGYSTQAQAVAGTVATSFMTPLRTKQAVDALQAIKSVNGQVGDILIDVFNGDYNSLSNKPTIPSTTNELTNNSGFVASNAAKLTVSANAPLNPSVNDIWIVI